jgi:hypothetical protein
VVADAGMADAAAVDADRAVIVALAVAVVVAATAAVITRAWPKKQTTEVTEERAICARSFLFRASQIRPAQRQRRGMS